MKNTDVIMAEMKAAEKENNERVNDCAFREGYACALDYAMERIDAAPIIDAVPVVRCRDCRLHDMCCNPVNDREGNGFCNRGARMDADAPERTGQDAQQGGEVRRDGSV